MWHEPVYVGCLVEPCIADARGLTTGLRNSRNHLDLGESLQSSPLRRVRPSGTGKPFGLVPPPDSGRDRISVHLKLLSDFVQQRSLVVQAHHVIGNRLKERRLKMFLPKRCPSRAPIGHRPSREIRTNV